MTVNQPVNYCIDEHGLHILGCTIFDFQALPGPNLAGFGTANLAGAGAGYG